MERSDNTRHRAPARHRKRFSAPKPLGGGVGSRLLIMLVFAAAVVASFAIFFRVAHIEVRGNSIYDVDTISQASGLQTGDNLLAVNKSAVAGKIRAALPYVEQVRVVRELPDTIVLQVTESDAVLAVKDTEGKTWLMSFGGKILEQAEAGDHPAALGFTLQNPVVGENAKSEQKDNLQAALVVLDALQGTGLADKVSKLDATKDYDLSFWYTDQFQVRLGGTDKIAYKIQYLTAVLEQLSQYQTGTIDLSFKSEKVARFIPW